MTLPPDQARQRAAEPPPTIDQARYRQFVDAMPQIAWIIRADGSALEYVNAQWLAYTGLSYAASLGDPNQAIHPDDRPGAEAAWQEALRTGRPYTLEMRLRRSDGAYRWFLARCVPVHDEGGRIVTWFGTSTDLHEQHEAAREARFLADLAERIRLATDAATLLDQVARALGEQLNVRRCLFIDIDTASDHAVVRHEHCRGVPSVPRTYRVSDYSPAARAAMARGQPIVNHDAQRDPRTAALYATTYQPYGERAYVAVPLMREGHWDGALWVSDDRARTWQPREVALLESVAERTWNTVEKLRTAAALQASEARLQLLYAQEQAARAHAEEASRLKDEFLATISHELRTPLTSLLGYLHLLQSRPRDDAYLARTLEKINRSARAQAQLTDDLLDVSRIISGKLHIEPQLINLATVVHAALDTVRLALEAKGLYLAVDLNPLLVVGDERRLQQVVWNLLTNAVKFTPPGGAIEVQLAPDGANAQLSVSDSGQGIHPDFLPFVFDRFRQADGTSTRRHGGLGLGLAIARHLVELHGGTVSAASAGEGRGATFTVRLPLGDRGRSDGPSWGIGEPAPAQSPCPPELRGLRVLVVDDQPQILELLHELLTQCHAVVTLASTAGEALRAIEQTRPQILISDLAMPEADGYWLIRALRALPPARGGATPAIALTAYVREEERERVLAAGFQQYLTKPVAPAELLAAVASLCRPVR